MFVWPTLALFSHAWPCATTWEEYARSGARGL
jgi:hypothetical protein